MDLCNQSCLPTPADRFVWQNFTIGHYAPAVQPRGKGGSLRLCCCCLLFVFCFLWFFCFCFCFVLFVCHAHKRHGLEPLYNFFSDPDRVWGLQNQRKAKPVASSDQREVWHGVEFERP